MHTSLRMSLVACLFVSQIHCNGTQDKPSDTGNLARAEAITKEIGDSLASCLNALAESDHLLVIDQFIEENYSRFPSQATENTLTVGSTTFSWGSDPLVFSFISPEFELQYEESYLETNGRVGELTLLIRNEEFGPVATVQEYTAKIDCSSPVLSYSFNRSLSERGYSYNGTSIENSRTRTLTAVNSTTVCEGESCESFGSVINSLVNNTLEGVTKGSLIRPEDRLRFRDFFVSELMYQIRQEF